MDGQESDKHLENSLSVESGENEANASLSPQRSAGDPQEEVDDIELIFSSDDKEYPQEDLVSITCYEPWQMSGQSGTPVLVNYAALSSDNEALNNHSETDGDEAAASNFERTQSQTLECSDSLVDKSKRRLYSASLEKSFDHVPQELSRDESCDAFEEASRSAHSLYRISDFIFPQISPNRSTFPRTSAGGGPISTYSLSQTFRRSATGTRIDATRARTRQSIGRSCTGTR